MTYNYLDTHKEVFGNGSGGELQLTTDYVSSTSFRIGDHDSLIMEIIPSDYSGAVINIKIQVSMDNGTSYFDLDQVNPEINISSIDGNSMYFFKMVPYSRHRILAKRTGGLETCSLLIYGSARMGIIGANIND